MDETARRGQQEPSRTTNAKDLLNDTDADYEFNQVRQRYEWTHRDTGLQVLITPKAGYRDGYGNANKGYEVVARNNDGDVVDDIHTIDGGTVISKADAKRLAYNWMTARPDGELLGTEEVEF